MANSFSKRIWYDGKDVVAVFVPELRKDGMYYEVNIKGFPRFFMSWSPLGRYDVISQKGLNLPYNLVLELSDVIEKSKQ